MAYAILTHDDVVGMIPTLSVLFFLGYGIYRCLAFIWRQCSSVVKLALTMTARTSASSKAHTRTQDDAELLVLSSSEMNSNPSASASANSRTHTTSVLFLLLLSYLLSPLSSMLHLRGFRISPRNRRNNNKNNIQPHELQHHQLDHNLHDLVYGEDPKLTKVLALTPSLLRGPQPPLLFTNRHLQFIPWLLQNELHRVEGIPFQRLHLRVNACVDKSHGTDYCERSPLMDDTVTLDVFPPFDKASDDGDTMDNNNHNSTSIHGRFHAGSPIVFFSPGLRCYSQDMPGNMIIRRLYGEGFRSVVVNRRGHTPGQKLQAPRWNLFGDVDDLEQVYWHIQREWAAPHTPFFLHGISSGTSVVVSALAEYDRRRYYLQQQKQSQSLESVESIDTARTTLLPRAAPSFVASISITPGYDISKVMLPNRFKYPYNPVMLDAVKTHFVRGNEQVLRAFDSDAVDAALAATHLQQFVDAVAPFAGYPNSTEYYKGENPVNWMHFVSTPSLILNAIDDPCCHVHNIYEQSPYPQHRGRSYATLIDESPRAILAVARSGSHCPFLDASSKTLRLLPAFIKDPLYGGWMLDSWADRVSIEFYKASLKVYEERRFMQ